MVEACRENQADSATKWIDRERTQYGRLEGYSQVRLKRTHSLPGYYFSKYIRLVGTCGIQGFIVITRRILDILYWAQHDISTKTHLLELSTVIHVVRNQIKCVLVNERPRDISLARVRDLIRRVYQSVNDVSVCY